MSDMHSARLEKEIRSMKLSKTASSVLALALMALMAPVWAVDGCKVLLCLAGPWQDIAQCVSEVQALFRSLWDGEPFPSCSFASGSVLASGRPAFGTTRVVSAQNTWLAQWSPTPDPACPAQFVTTIDFMGSTRYGCRYAGVVAVYVDGQPWSRTLWSPDGGSFSESSASSEMGVGPQSSTTVREAEPALWPNGGSMPVRAILPASPGTSEFLK